MAKAWARVLAPVPDEALPECYSRAIELHATSSQRTFPLPATLMLAAWEGMAARRETVALCNRPDELPGVCAPGGDIPVPDEPPPAVCPTCRAVALLMASGMYVAQGIACPECGTVTP